MGKAISLNGIWSLTYGPYPGAKNEQPVNAPPANWPTIPATVPGNVELDMIAAGHLEPLGKGRARISGSRIWSPVSGGIVEHSMQSRQNQASGRNSYLTV